MHNYRHGVKDYFPTIVVVYFRSGFSPGISPSVRLKRRFFRAYVRLVRGVGPVCYAGIAARVGHLFDLLRFSRHDMVFGRNCLSMAVDRKPLFLLAIASEDEATRGQQADAPENVGNRHLL